MGGAKPWPTRWPEPHRRIFDPDKPFEPLQDPDYIIEPYPAEPPQELPEEYLDPIFCHIGRNKSLQFALFTLL